MKKYLLPILIVLCMSCKQEENPDFTLESFPKTSEITDFEELKIDSLSLYDPQFIRYHPDSFLVILDNKGPYSIKIVDLINKKVHRFIERGRGPKELLGAWGLSVYDKKIWVYGVKLFKGYFIDPLPNRTFEVGSSVSFQEHYALDVAPYTGGNFVGLDPGDKYRALVTDKEGRKIRELGDFWQLGNNVKPNNIIFMSNLEVSPENDRFVLACLKTGFLEFYNGEKMIKRVLGPDAVILEGKNKVTSFGTSYSVSPRFNAFGYLDGTANEFWAGYVGKEYPKGKTSRKEVLGIPQILRFSWDGQPTERMALGQKIFAFSVDEKGRTVYCISTEKEPSIVYFNY